MKVKYTLEVIKNDKKWIITKENGLYNYIYQEYSKYSDSWLNVSKDSGYSKEAIQLLLGIKIDF